MALPKWLNDIRDDRDVSNEDILLAIPELSDEDWARGTDRYLRESAQLTVFLQTMLSESEKTLEGAASFIRAGKVSDAEPLLQDVLGRMEDSSEPQDARVWTRVALTGRLLPNNHLGRTAEDRGLAALRSLGLTDVAEMVGTYGRISDEFGSEVADVFSMGILAKVDGWCVAKHLAMGVSVSGQRSDIALRRLSEMRASS